jgi:hypothetical protein
MEYYDLQVFTGPPESVRETILVAAKTLERGDWKACRDLILSLPVLQLIPNAEGLFSFSGFWDFRSFLLAFFVPFGRPR